MARDYKKEREWERKTYQIFTFKANKANGEADRLKELIGERTFAEWVREKIANDEK